MILLVSGATRTLRQLPDKSRLGHLLTPRAGDSIDTLLANGLPVAADNCAFSAWDETAFVRMLHKLRGKPVMWVTAPEVVGDASATLALFEKWEPIIRGYGLPVALVGQDGLQNLEVPWQRSDCLFWAAAPGGSSARTRRRSPGRRRGAASGFTWGA